MLILRRNSRSGYRGGAVVVGGPGVANRCLALLSKMFNLESSGAYDRITQTLCAMSEIP